MSMNTGPKSVPLIRAAQNCFWSALGRENKEMKTILEIHSLINATFAPRPVRCTYHVARSELCLLHKPHQINIPSRPRSSNGLILAILPNGKHAPRPLRARFRSTVPSLAGVARSWRAPCTRLA